MSLLLFLHLQLPPKPHIEGYALLPPHYPTCPQVSMPTPPSPRIHNVTTSPFCTPTLITEHLFLTPLSRPPAVLWKEADVSDKLSQVTTPLTAEECTLDSNHQSQSPECKPQKQEPACSKRLPERALCRAQEIQQ